MIHAPEDVMCYAVQEPNPCGRTQMSQSATSVQYLNTARALSVFFPRNARKVWRSGSHAKVEELAYRQKQSGIKDWKSLTTEEMNQQDESDAKRYKPGKMLSCNNIGPVNPKSLI
jgi:hypothetical protein